ncbi:hypothetical protein C8F04DRAFT_237010 [Mycena alexandri]|uniref:Uncharacterized protein n=1 Tax=Mycena alexandri TaxID=1745969 RepID=A0AAD6S8V3_9AGAR|nr:hypothetical protein C8F04DRAFT_237010 [Mycena alexandri]
MIRRRCGMASRLLLSRRFIAVFCTPLWKIKHRARPAPLPAPVLLLGFLPRWATLIPFDDRVSRHPPPTRKSNRKSTRSTPRCHPRQATKITYDGHHRWTKPWMVKVVDRLGLRWMSRSRPVRRAGQSRERVRTSTPRSPVGQEDDVAKYGTCENIGVSLLTCNRPFE